LIRRSVACLSASALAGLATFVVSPGGAGASPARGAVTHLAGDVIPGLSALKPTGPTPAGQRIEINLDLVNTKASAETALNRALYTKGSPDYHHFLTPAQFASEFAVPAGETASAVQWATRDGLTVGRISATGDLLALSGTVGQAEQTFGVSIADYVWHGLHFYANTADPSVPAALQIFGVDGLNSAQKMHTFNHAPAASARHGSSPAQDTCDPSGSVCVGVTTPNDIRSAYDAPSANKGEGQTAAVFGEGDYNGPIKDLRLFEANFKLPKVPVQVVLSDTSTNPADYSDTAGDGEWDLDTQAITGVAPDIQQLDLYFGTSLNDADVARMFSAWADDKNGPLQANASFGECEYNPASSALPSADDFPAGQTFTAETERVLTQANAEGRTLFASSGDTGSSCPVVPVDVNGVGNEAFPDVAYPCASPEAVCVGGTVLYTTGGDTEAAPDPSSHATRVLEYTWTYTGGGSSVVFPQPAWQAKATPLPGQCLYDDSGTPVSGPTPCRAVPDVAAQSGDVVTNGYSIYSSGQLTENGGTSLSSPLNVGMWTLDQAASPKALGNGFAAPAFYANSGDFFDIGGGSSSPPTGNGYFVSTPGWDYVSGLGVQDVTSLEKAIDNGITPTNDIPSPDTGTETVVTPSGTVVSGGGGSGSGSGGPAADAACVPLFTGTANTAGYPAAQPVQQEPQLDILQGDMHTVTIGGTPELQTILTIQNMQDGASAVAEPGGANEYYMTWTYKGTTYFTNAEVSAIGDSYSYGTVSKVGASNQYSNTGTVTGAIVTGANGTVTVDVPLSDVGSPAAGDTLGGPAGFTYVEIGAPGVGGSLQQVNNAGPGNNYTLGEVCAATGQPGSDGAAPAGGQVPEAPVAIGIPALGLAIAGGLVIRRRRRVAAKVGD
jgi:hypothetical protein